MHRSNFTLSPKGTRLPLLHVSKASPALSPAKVETHGKLSQGMSQAEHEALFFLWVGFQLLLSPDPACQAGAQALALGMHGWEWSPLWQQHRLQSESAAPSDTGGIAGQCESEAPWDVCAWAEHVALCVCDHAHGQVLSHRHSRAVPQAWKLAHTGLLSWLGKVSPSCCHQCIFFLSVVQPWRPPWALHGICLAATMFCMPAGLHFIYQQPCLEQCLIFWLPFVVIVQCLCALMPISLSCTREAAARQKSPKDFCFPFPHEFRHEEVLEEHLMNNSALVEQCPPREAVGQQWNPHILLRPRGIWYEVIHHALPIPSLAPALYTLCIWNNMHSFL